jgi:uncharacterized protein
VNRSDYAFPFRIDPASGQAAQTSYPSHVHQMIRQILLTSPGERADLPEFGCGIRQLVFAPNSAALDSTAQILVQQALNRWLSDQITVQKVTVSQPTPGQENTIQLEIDYTLIETQTNQQLALIVS